MLDDTFQPAKQLAKGLDRDLTQTFNIVKNALGGSRHALLQLRDSYGITPTQLIQSGAESDKNGEIVNDTPESIGRLRTAFLSIVEAKFGGSEC